MDWKRYELYRNIWKTPENQIKGKNCHLIKQVYLKNFSNKKIALKILLLLFLIT